MPNPHGAVRMVSTSAQATTRCRSARRRLRQVQRAGDLPDVIYRDDDEDSWRPTREELQLQLISRDEFDACRPVAAGSPELARLVASLRATSPPPGRRVADDRSPRLLEFLSALPAMRELRAELQGMRPPAAPTLQALECLCSEITRAARWGRTVEISTAQAPLWAEYRRRLAERDGPAQIITGTTA
jgi:hypothetical protein